MRTFAFHPNFRPQKNYPVAESVFNELAKTPFAAMFKNDFLTSKPDVNIKETETTFQVDLAAPGLEKTDFNINVEKDVLTIAVKKEVDNEVKEENFTHREFSYSTFTRTFHLPENINKENISANYENGILVIKLPKIVTDTEANAKKVINVL